MNINTVKNKEYILILGFFEIKLDSTYSILLFIYASSNYFSKNSL